jgi:hypothetical protein
MRALTYTGSRNILPAELLSDEFARASYGRSQFREPV